MAHSLLTEQRERIEIRPPEVHPDTSWREDAEAEALARAKRRHDLSPSVLTLRADGTFTLRRRGVDAGRKPSTVLRGTWSRECKGVLLRIAHFCLDGAEEEETGRRARGPAALWQWQACVATPAVPSLRRWLTVWLRYPA